MWRERRSTAVAGRLFHLTALKRAPENARWQNVERLKIFSHRGETGLQRWQDRVRELVDKQGAVWREHLSGLLQDLPPVRIGDHTVRNS